MDNSEWHVRVNRPIDMLGLQIFMYRKWNGQVFVVEPMKLIERQVESGELVEPSLFLNEFTAKPLIKALGDAVNDLGMKTESEELLLGQMAAMKEHMKDLQKIISKLVLREK